MRRTRDGWEIRIYVDFYAATTSQCSSYRNGQREGVQIGILTSRQKFLARQSHFYQLRCDGVVAQASAPATLVTRPGKVSRPFAVTSSVLDRRHIIRSVRRCFYDVETREIVNCYNDAITKVAKRTAQGWTMTRQVQFDNTSSRQCKLYERERPRQEYRITYRDGRGDRVGTAQVSFRITCLR